MTETKDIKDYISLYIGQPIMVEQDGKGTNLGLYFPDVWTAEGNTEPNGVNVLSILPDKHKVYAMNFNQVKLILRPLSDMQDDELKTIARISNIDFKERSLDHALALENIKANGIKAIKFDENLKPIEVFEITRYLLSRGFDLFGLIEAGIAIDKTTIKTPTP